MDLRAFLPALARYAGIADQDLLEKDVRLHFLLQAFAGDPTLGEDLVFKGGTCLIKCYLAYPRFSIDLDFTWRRQHDWAHRGTKRAREAIRPVRRAVLRAIDRHGRALGMERPASGGVTYGRSGQMMTAALHYRSATRVPEFVKVQVNLVEPILFEVRPRNAASLLGGRRPGELEFLEPDLTGRYAAAVACPAYDPREILAEKCRAILTREATKARDLLDLYLIETELGLRVEDHLDAVRKKVRFSADRTERYRRHLAAPGERFQALREEDVRPLLLRDVDLEGFDACRTRILRVLEAQGRALRVGGG